MCIIMYMYLWMNIRCILIVLYFKILIIVLLSILFNYVFSCFNLMIWIVDSIFRLIIGLEWLDENVS